MVYVTGDLHGDFSPLFRFSESEEGKCLKKSDYVIVLGDFGIWPETLDAIKELNRSLNFTLLFIEGNHDHPMILRSFPKEQLLGGMAHNIFGVYHLCRGEIFSIPTEEEDLIIAVCGGGDSRDQYKRTPGIDWFEEEKITEHEVQRLLEKASVYHGKVDYFLSHTLSSAVKAEWNYECSRGSCGKCLPSEILESDYKIRDMIGGIHARIYFSAHEHIDREFLLSGKRYRSVYREFVRL